MQISTVDDFVTSKTIVNDELEEKLFKLNSVKWYIEVTVNMVKYDRKDEEMTADVVFRGEMEILLAPQDIQMINMTNN